MCRHNWHISQVIHTDFIYIYLALCLIFSPNHCHARPNEETTWGRGTAEVYVSSSAWIKDRPCAAFECLNIAFKSSSKSISNTIRWIMQMMGNELLCI